MQALKQIARISSPNNFKHARRQDLKIDINCNLCTEFSGQATPLHLEMFDGAPAQRVLLATANFVVVPSIGALRSGHLLVFPKKHSFGILRLSAPMIQECDALVRLCAERLRSIYREPVLVFEHGSNPESVSVRSSCIAHAHVHVLPGSPSFISSIIHSGRTRSEHWGAPSSLTKLEPQSSDYLFIGSIDDTNQLRLHLKRSDRPAPSQFFRREYATYSDSRTHWDWRLEPAPELFMQTLTDWQERFGNDQRS